MWKFQVSDYATNQELRKIRDKNAVYDAPFQRPEYNPEDHKHFVSTTGGQHGRMYHRRSENEFGSTARNTCTSYDSD
jgi:hypothetical protein